MLRSLDVSLDKVRAEVERVVGKGKEAVAGQIPFTPRAKRVLELALREAVSVGSNHIGTEHLLLGIVRENEGVAARILVDLGADSEAIRNAVSRRLGSTRPRPPHAAAEASGRRPLRPYPRGPFGRRSTGWPSPPLALAAGWLMFGLALGLGILIGWLIWG